MTMQAQITTNTEPHPTRPQEQAAPDPVRVNVRVDVWEAPDELVVRGDFPGVTAEALNVRLEDGELLIEGTRQATAHAPPIVYGRRVRLASGVDVSSVSAELSQGVLTIRLPKSEEVKPRRIPVRGE
jgi:HSP20 family protein